jgi:hypothetical protein
MERIEGFPAGLVDVPVGCEAVEGLKTPGEVVSGHEVCDASSKLVTRFAVEALDGGIIDGVVPLDLTV